MDDYTLLRIDDTLAVPRAELTYRATRAGGPGGQHVNTSSTRVELSWDVAQSPSLSDEQRARIMEKLANRIDQEGILRLTDAGSRSQHQNKEDATRRFAHMLAQALHLPRPRKQTRVPRAQKEARLRAKKNRSRIKQQRGRVKPDE